MWFASSLLIISFPLWLISCKQNENKHSFCYWQRTFAISGETKAILQHTGAAHLYVRYFDVDWNSHSQTAQPVGTIIAESAFPCDFTPTIFITNKVFDNISHSAIDALASHIHQRVMMVNQKFENLALTDSVKGDREAPTIMRNCHEILFDCDWTPRTSANYFYFLRAIQNLFRDKEIAATLRLWQYKHRQLSGIPPVKRCLLMCYNVSDPKKISTANSIADTHELAAYLTQQHYPLPLDIALPIFSWGVVFHNNKYLGLLSEINGARLDKDTTHFKEYTQNHFLLVKDTLIGNYYLRNGDVIRMEEVSAQDLHRMIDRIKKQVSLQNNSRLSFFSLDTQYVNRYGYKKIRQYYSFFDR